ncbi:carboxymuconolactone decarboxylase family protein [Microlunatus capsulatus]|uniref:Peroxidase-related enzyme n=1 Tax=Microlunatus capsulatus TaxID=99117 RepID=A0ABS4Z6N9_9ACTN|nr:hypothetical protein [Microlunatus capsulatus]MBP2416445.1 putative peroxidase-related enzyme [Microlunatus capsulatus]
MGYLDEPPVEGAVADLYAADEARLGYVANYTRAFAHRPEVYRAWQALNTAVKAAMDPVRYEVATVAAAGELRSSYCSLAHGQVLAGQLGEDEAVRVAEGRPGDPAVAAVAALARQVVSEPSAVAPADLEPLRALGFSDADVLDVVLAAAARSFFSSVLEATGTEPDPGYAALPDRLRSALTVGRPVQAADG